MAAACNDRGFQQLLDEIDTLISNDLDKKMIIYLKTLTYDDALTKNFGNMIIGRIIKENNLQVTNIANLRECDFNVENCDNLLFQIVKNLRGVAAATPHRGLFEDAYNIYPSLSYHAKMRLQFIIYRLIYVEKTPEYDTEANRRNFVNFFDKRCLNAQYRNILYSSMNVDDKKIMTELNKTARPFDFGSIEQELKNSILNIEPNNANPPKFDFEGNIITIQDDNDILRNLVALKAIFENKMRIMGGNKGVHMYHLCSSSVNISLKKVQAKTAREGAKIMARKLLNKSGNKSVKFSLKRMIGNKEKYYNYQASIDKSGKISIKST
jgi:hypothetical protein